MSDLGTEHQESHQQRRGRYQSRIPDAGDEQRSKGYLGSADGVSDQVRQSVLVELPHDIGQAYDPNERDGERDDNLCADGGGMHGVGCFLCGGCLRPTVGRLKQLSQAYASLDSYAATPRRSSLSIHWSDPYRCSSRCGR